MTCFLTYTRLSGVPLMKWSRIMDIEEQFTVIRSYSEKIYYRLPVKDVMEIVNPRNINSMYGVLQERMWEQVVKLESRRKV